MNVRLTSPSQDTIIAGNTPAGVPVRLPLRGAARSTTSGGNLLGTPTGDRRQVRPRHPHRRPQARPARRQRRPQRRRTRRPARSSRPRPCCPAAPPSAGRRGAGIPEIDERGFARPGRRLKPAIGAYEPQYAANATANQVFVENVYEVLFNRAADPGGPAGPRPSSTAAATPTALVQILQTSTEYLNDQVALLYNRYLGRALGLRAVGGRGRPEGGRHPRAGRRQPDRLGRVLRRLRQQQRRLHPGRLRRPPWAGPRAPRPSWPPGTRSSRPAGPLAASPRSS